MYGLRVLLVEDNAADADLTREALEEGAPPMRIDVAVDGQRAMDVLNGHASDDERPHLVILDLNLPRRRGSEVLAAMRASNDLKRIPVIIWSSSDNDAEVRSLYELGANCFLTKPLDLEKFQATMKAVQRFWLDVARLPVAVT